jgi:hypothetical protein
MGKSHYECGGAGLSSWLAMSLDITSIGLIAVEDSVV